MTWLCRGNLRRETESLLKAAKNNDVRTNYVKEKTDNRKSRLCDVRDETEESLQENSRKGIQKLVDLMGKVIHRELCKRVKF